MKDGMSAYVSCFATKNTGILFSFPPCEGFSSSITDRRHVHKVSNSENMGIG